MHHPNLLCSVSVSPLLPQEYIPLGATSHLALYSGWLCLALSSSMNEWMPSHQHHNDAKWNRDNNSCYRNPPPRSYDNDLHTWLNILGSPSDEQVFAVTLAIWHLTATHWHYASSITIGIKIMFVLCSIYLK